MAKSYLAAAAGFSQMDRISLQTVPVSWGIQKTVRYLRDLLRGVACGAEGEKLRRLRPELHACSQRFRLLVKRNLRAGALPL